MLNKFINLTFASSISLFVVIVGVYSFPINSFQ